MPFTGKKLKTCRDRKKWSLTDLSAYAGVNKGYLSNLENGVQTNPGMDIVEKLAKVFEVTIDYFSDATKDTKSESSDYPRGLQDLIRQQEKTKQPLDKKSIEFMRQILDRSPNNWSVQEWKSVYKSYLKTLPVPPRISSKRK